MNMGLAAIWITCWDLEGRSGKLLDLSLIGLDCVPDNIKYTPMSFWDMGRGGWGSWCMSK